MVSDSLPKFIEKTDNGVPKWGNTMCTTKTDTNSTICIRVPLFASLREQNIAAESGIHFTEDKGDQKILDVYISQQTLFM